MECTASTSHATYSSSTTNGCGGGNAKSIKEEASEHQYDELFPPLGGGGGGMGGGSAASLSPMSSNASASGKKQSPIGTPKPLPPKISPTKNAHGATVGDGRGGGKSSSTVLVIPWEERRFQQVGASGEAQQRRLCQDIALRSAVTVGMNVNKDRSLSISITGKADAVQEVRKTLSRELVTQSQMKVEIPQDYHRFILGKKGAQLRDMEQRTGTKINVPRPEEHSNEITIQGSKDALLGARDELLNVFHDQARRAQDTLNAPKIYHPFLCGPYNRYIDDLRERRAVKVNVPPPNVQSDQIVIVGEKESVAEAKRELEARLQAAKKDCQTLTFHISKAKHRYVIGVRGSGLSDILEQTGVSVEMPPADSKVEEITLRGPQANLGNALNLMIERSQSMTQISLPAPVWLHRHLIGPKGAHLARITDNREKLRVDFLDDGSISIEGPLKDAVEVAAELESKVKNLQESLTMSELKNVNVAHHKHIVGRAGSNIERLHQEFDVSIKLDSSGTVRFEGPPQGVAQAKLDIETMLQKMENEKKKDLIIDHRFHRHIIGAHGSGVRELRSGHPEVQINFPDAASKSNIVQLRGPRQDVDAVAQALMAKYKELANVEEIVVDIPAALHAALIGSKGHVLRNIQAECGGGVQIKFPRLDKSASQDNKSAAAGDKVVVRGPKEEALKAKQLLLQLAKEKEALSFEDTVKCRPELHKFLIGKGGSSLHEMRQATGARVILPAMTNNEVCEDLPPSASATPQDVITLIGSKEAVAKAKDLLQKRIVELESIEDRAVSIDPKWHRHFVQRRGQLLNSISLDCGGVNISFPSRAEEGQEANDVVRVKGPIKCVEAAIARLQEVVAELESQVNTELVVPSKYHRALIGPSGQLVRDIQDQFKVNIRFPPAPNRGNSNGGGDFSADNEPAAPAPEDDSANTILLSGSAENCELAKEALLCLVPVEKTLPLSSEFHGALVGAKGQLIQKLQRDHEVQIQIPDASLAEDAIVVKGKPTCVENFKEALAQLCQEWEKAKEDRVARSFLVECFVPVSFHRQLIGTRGARIQELMEQFEVNISMPRSQQSRGATASEEAPEDNGDVATDDADEETTTPATPELQPAAVATAQGEGGNAAERIVIRGYQEKALAARQALLDRVEYLKKLVTVELTLPSETHSRLIGQRRRNLRKIIEDYNVEDITFPSMEAKDKDLVLVTGPQDKVDACSDHLVDLANEFMDQYDERQMFSSSARGGGGGAPPAGTLMQRAQFNVKEVSSNGRGGKSSGFSVAGAPWQKPQQQQPQPQGKESSKTGAELPDTSNCDEFPSISSTSNNASTQQQQPQSNGWNTPADAANDGEA